MEEKWFKIFGIVLILLGLFGFLLFGTNILGKVIAHDGPTLSISVIEDVLLKKGGQKSFEVIIYNNGSGSITNCSSYVVGEVSEWVSVFGSEEIISFENEEFNFEVNIPEETEFRDYPMTFILECDEESLSETFSIAVTKGIEAVKIREIKVNKNILNIIYTFNNEGFFGDSTFVDIWVRDPEGFEVFRTQDEFSIATEKLIVREVEAKLPGNVFGVYGVYFAHPSDSESYLKKSVILGDSKTSGNVVFNVSEGKGLPYLAFLFFILLGTFFIFMSHRKSVRKSGELISTGPKLKKIKTNDLNNNFK